MEGFVYQIVIAAGVEQVWAALTSPEFTRKFWFGREVVSEWTKGSPVRIVTPEGTDECRGVVVETTRPTRLAYTLNSLVGQDPDRKETTVVFEIQAMGPLVKLTVQQDLEVTANDYHQAVAGWTFILNGLKTLLETGEPMPALPWKKD